MTLLSLPAATATTIMTRLVAVVPFPTVKVAATTLQVFPRKLQLPRRETLETEASVEVPAAVDTIRLVTGHHAVAANQDLPVLEDEVFRDRLENGMKSLQEKASVPPNRDDKLPVAASQRQAAKRNHLMESHLTSVLVEHPDITAERTTRTTHKTPSRHLLPTNQNSPV